jgi:hypothetical protein
VYPHLLPSLRKARPSYIGIKFLVNVFQPTDSRQDAEKIDNDPTRHAEPWTDEDQACFSISIRSLNYQTLKQLQGDKQNSLEPFLKPIDKKIFFH